METEQQKVHPIDQPDISIVIPLFEESQSLPELVDRIDQVLQESFEVILVDDGSRDDSWKTILELSKKYSWIQGIRLQRNYGKSTALQAGFDAVRGKYVVTLDADLQDDPDEIPAMLDKLLEEGYDLVSGWKKKRQDPLNKTIPSRFFNMVTRLVTGIHLHDFNCGLKAYHRRVIDQIYLYGELHRYVPLLAQWQGYDRIGEKEVVHHPRKHGQTKFGISRFIHGFLDLLTLMFVNNYMSRPMHFFGSFGILSLATGGLINLYLAYAKIILGQSLSNRPLLFLGVMLVVIGVQFFSIGFLGDMINRGQVRKDKPNIRERI